MIDKIKNEIEQEQKFISILKKVQTAVTRIGEPDMPVNMSTYYKQITFAVGTLDDVKKMRHWLRDALGTWNDRLNNRWYSLGIALTSWRSDEYPEELQGEHCQWKLEEHHEPKYVFVCDNQHKENE